ncbi:MAG: hypothetical protein NVSMB23_20070 [Myxococcales bacterium]
MFSLCAVNGTHPRARPSAAAGALLALALLLAGCIERPWQDAPAAQGRRAVDRTALGDVLIAQLPPDVVPVGAVFGGAAELVGYRVEPSILLPGGRARLTFYWRSRAELEAWHIFVHLDDANGGGERIHGEHDPAQGRYPTDAWRPGDLVADPVLFVPGRNPLSLFVGFYTQGDNRLPLTSAGRGRDDGNSRLFAGTLAVSPTP